MKNLWKKWMLIAQFHFQDPNPAWKFESGSEKLNSTAVKRDFQSINQSGSNRNAPIFVWKLTCCSLGGRDRERSCRTAHPPPRPPATQIKTIRYGMVLLLFPSTYRTYI